MSVWTKAQRAIAAAHLCDLAAKSFRTGDVYCVGLLRAYDVLMEDDPEHRYVYALGCYGVHSPDDIDAAVAAIVRGEHPPGSLPGRALVMRARSLDASRGSKDGYMRGRADMAVDIIALLGCEVPK